MSGSGSAKGDKRWWEKWDRAARSFDFMNSGVERRYGREKGEWFSRAVGKTLLVAVGTGLDLHYFPPGHDVTGIDISAKMLEKAREKLDRSLARSASRSLQRTNLVQTDVEKLAFGNATFDTVVTSCTFCSVPDPVAGLRELRRVLKPGGALLMFEHVRSDIFWMGPMMDLMTRFSRRFGPDLNRRTGRNIVKAGFTLTREVNISLDMVKLFEAVKGGGSLTGGVGAFKKQKT